MRKIESFKNNGIFAESFFSIAIEGMAFGNYDILITTSSWDPRCLNLTEALIPELPFGFLLLFDDKDEHGYRTFHDEALQTWMARTTKEYEIVNGYSTDVFSVFKKLFDRIVNISINLGRPVNILFDLSTCPRFISLSTLSAGFDVGVVRRIDYFYGECLYPQPAGGILGGVEEVMFTSGEWNTLPLDHCLGQFDPSLKSLFTVSIGFEGNKILRVLNNEDPDLLTVLMPDPGFSDAYVGRVIEANSELFREFELDPSSALRAHAGDAVSAWRTLDVANRSGDKRVNQSYLCAGSKPHSLGLTLSAMTNDHVSVLYTLPKEHNFVKVEPLSKYWIYSIINLTVPTIE